MKKNNRGGRYAAPRGKNRLVLILALCLVLISLVVGILVLLSIKPQEPRPTQNAHATTAPTLPVTTAPPETTAAPTTVPETVPETEATTVPTTEPETVPTEPDKIEPPVMLSQYQEKYDQNHDLYGWIRIDGTQINYPLMRSPAEPDKYLYADFNGNYLFAGSIYADAKCSFETDNMLIYGHNMLDGSRFRSLMNYENKNFWESHPTIYISDLYEEYEYEIVAAFRDRVYRKSETCFKFYQFIDAEDEEEFDYAIQQFKDKATYDTGVEAHYGDHLITLITCAYHTENGRFVVVARRK